MALPPQAEQWMKRAEIDYIGPFVKAWAAFNAWYRDDSRKDSERAMLDWVKAEPNPVRRGILAYLRNDTAEAQALKQAISDLQLRLAVHLPNADVADRADWPRQHAWIVAELAKFRRVFSDRVKALRLDEVPGVDDADADPDEMA